MASPASRSKDGEAPNGPGEVAIDKATADKHDYEVGDNIDIVFDSGTESFTIVGLVGLGNADGFGGATLAMFDPETARQVLGAGDTYDAIDIKLDRGSRPRHGPGGDRGHPAAPTPRS